MEKVLNEYLEKMEKYLKPIAVSERVDIIKEIKSEMQELQSNDIPAEQIIERFSYYRSYFYRFWRHISDFSSSKND